MVDLICSACLFLQICLLGWKLPHAHEFLTRGSPAALTLVCYLRQGVPVQVDSQLEIHTRGHFLVTTLRSIPVGSSHWWCSPPVPLRLDEGHGRRCRNPGSIFCQEGHTPRHESRVCPVDSFHWEFFGHPLLQIVALPILLLVLLFHSVFAVANCISRACENWVVCGNRNGMECFPCHRMVILHVAAGPWIHAVECLKKRSPPTRAKRTRGWVRARRSQVSSKSSLRPRTKSSLKPQGEA